MFELLLQADRALSGGNLDQAERTYWQLSELDPTNAIAIAGLARVALERGDVRLARLFATRALVMDPESVAATRILETIGASDEDAQQEPEPLPEGLPLIAAQRLESLSYRRFIRDEDSERGPLPEQHLQASMDDATPPSEPEPGPGPETLPELPVEPLQASTDASAPPSEPGPEPAPEPSSPASGDDDVAPPSEPGSEPAPEPLPQHQQLPQLLVEPPRDRRRIGRELAAAAAEMETGAAPDPVLRRRPSGRPEFHLTPIPERGRRRFEPGEMKAPPLADDPFAAAESEAVVEALGDMDEVDEEDSQERQLPESARPAETVQDDDPFEDVDDTEAGESVALRIALLGDESGRETVGAASAISDEPDDLLDLRMSLLAGEADLQEADLGAAEDGQPTGQEDDLIAQRIASLVRDAKVEAAEREPATGTPELAAEPEAAGTTESAGEVALEPEPEATAEQEAEAEALREAAAMHLDGETPGADPEATPVASAQSSEPTESSEPADPEPQRRRGFLRRIIGG